MHFVFFFSFCVPVLAEICIKTDSEIDLSKMQSVRIFESASFLDSPTKFSCQTDLEKR